MSETQKPKLLWKALLVYFVVSLPTVKGAGRCLSRTAVGMEKRRIPDSSIQGSSQYSGNVKPIYGRLFSIAKCWIPKNVDPNPWIRVDLGSIENVTKIATQGRDNANQYTKEYILSYSLDGNNFQSYKSDQVFVANYDRNTVVGHVLRPPIEARYVRLHPKSKNGFAAIRMELYTGQCSDVNYYLGGPHQNCDEVCQSRDQLCLDIDHGFTDSNTVSITQQLIGKTCQTGFASTDLYIPSSKKPAYIDEQHPKTGGRCIGWKNIPENIDCRKSSRVPETRRVCPCNKVKHARICQDKGGYLQCTNGKAIKVVKANFGRTEYDVCPGSVIFTTDCRDNFSLDIVRDKCEGNAYCDIWSSVRTLGSDPCTGTSKYLQTEYECTGEIIPVILRKENCSSPLGMEDGSIPHSDITSSSFYNAQVKAHVGRLNTLIGSGAWIAGGQDLNPYLQVNFKRRVKVTMIATQGRFVENDWVKSYTLSYGDDWNTFEKYTQSEKVVVFYGNWDRHTVVTNKLSPPILAHLVRIHPVTWQGHMALRAEIYGCDAPCTAEPYCDVCSAVREFSAVGGKSLSGHVIATFQVGHANICQLFCLRSKFCLSFNLGPVKRAKRTCEISDADHVRHPDHLVSRDGHKYYGMENACSINPCLNNGSCQPIFMNGTYKCHCTAKFNGTNCEVETNECVQKTHTCDPGADCIPTKESYNCSCRKGYTGDGFTCYAPETCTDILEKDSSSPSGAYYLKQKGGDPQLVYCHMKELTGCSGRGWTLVMKVNGTKDTFKFSSPYWANNIPYDAGGGRHGLEVQNETKTHAYWSAPLTKLCLGMSFKDTTKWLEITHFDIQVVPESVLPPLQVIWRTHHYIPTSGGRAGWKSLLVGSSLQPYCNREGYNPRVNTYGKGPALRIGIISNQQNDCNTQESFLGFGLTKRGCGNHAMNNKNADNGPVDLEPFCYIMLK